MRRAILQKRTKGLQTSKFYSLPAPTKGWNARDALANMDEGYAVVADNIYPETTDVMVRKGFSEHVTDIGAEVESLMPYNAPAGTTTLFAAADDSFYDVTTPGAVGAAVVTGLSNARWQSVNFTNSSGTSYLCCFNGVDNPRYWNGSAWIEITGASTPAITGLTTSNIVSAAVHKRRLWLVEEGSLKAWFLPVDSVGGAADAIDLSGIADKGGYIVAIGAWTIDGGAGLDDYWVAITSEGQVIVYVGTNPTSSTEWYLTGVWNVGEPIGRRCMMKYRGDLLVVLVDGVFPLSAALTSSQTNPQAAITDNISNAMSSAAEVYKTNFGWCLLFYPQAHMLILNVPVGDGIQQQYVMNTINRSWGGPFKGVPANCWAVFNEDPYFGGDGAVYKFWDTFADNGANIDFDLKQAFSYFKSRRLKQFKSMRANLLATAPPSILMGLNLDFADAALTGSTSFSPSVYGTWDDALWDDALWGTSALTLFNDWQTVLGVGVAAAPRMKGSINGIELRSAATDHIYEEGGFIG